MGSPPDWLAYHQTALPAGSPQVFTTLQTHRTGIGFLPHSISTLPILMARRSHCLRRLTACKAASTLGLWLNASIRVMCLFRWSQPCPTYGMSLIARSVL